MKYESLRERVRNLPKWPGTQTIARSPVIHEGFPGKFNLSYAEKPWLDTFGKYIDVDEEYNFSVVQSCIRHQDLEALSDPRNHWKYLGVFEMADVAGFITSPHKPDYMTMQRFQAQRLVDLLEDVGIGPERIYPSVHQGGSIAEVTDGKYDFDFYAPRDNISFEAYADAGIPERNIILDNTRDTFLSLHLHRPTPWGYRNEVHVDIGTQRSPRLLDVATIEYLCYRPVFEDGTTSKDIVGVDDYDQTVSIAAVGLERLCRIIQDVENIQEIDYLQEFYAHQQSFGEVDVLAGESLRALHRIYSDWVSLGEPSLNKSRRYIINRLTRNIPYDLSAVRELLETNDALQPWHDDLVGTDALIDRIGWYRDFQKNQ